MIQPAVTLLAQMNDNLLETYDPRLPAGSSSNGMTWVIVAVILVAILAITFKTSKRNAILKHD